jgi:NAD(P)H-hydrate repair Nnr-like enzyme with NAD(P)H-hydrate dehydratase domain
MDHSYWKKQTFEKPLFPDIEWSRPEQRSKSGRLGIVGGNKLGFMSVAESYQTAMQTGVGEVRVLLPADLKKTVPAVITDVIYGPSNLSGGLNRESLGEMKALGQWASGILLIGDAGRNSETAILYEEFVREYDGPLIITRDAIDLLKNNFELLANRENTLMIASFAQLQKIFQYLYYPKVLTFSMQLTNLVEAVHKFTITYPVNIVVFHKDLLIVASNGIVTTTPCNDPMKIWKGDTATKAAAYWLWNTSKPLESITASLIA